MWMTAHPNRARDRRWSRAGAAITGFGACAAAFVLVAPTAGAAVTTVTASPAQGMSFGLGNYGTNCQYRVTATVDNSSSDPVQFADSAGGSFSPNPATVVGNQATTVWIPGATGQHTISATQGAGPAWTSPAMTVGNGMNLGFACLVMP